MSLDIKRMQKLAGIITEGFTPEEEVQESTKYTKSSLKSKIKEMILKEMETPEDELEEAKKEEAPEEEMPAEEMPAEEMPAEEMPMDDEENSELTTPEQVQKELMQALKASKKLGDKKLTRQIGNVLTYFTRTQISSDEEM
jgi:hypothetical protein